jgi:hypothetical protein
MLYDKQHAGAATLSYKKTGWMDLREDIYDLFQEAQQRDYLAARRLKVHVKYYRAWSLNTRHCMRCGEPVVEQLVNVNKNHGAFCFKHMTAVGRAQDSQYKIEPLIPADDPRLCCFICGHKEHNEWMIRFHMKTHTKDQVLQLNKQEPVIWNGTEEQLCYLKAMGWP